MIDLSVLLDIMAPSAWRDWSERQLALALEAGEVAINQIIYPEIANRRRHRRTPRTRTQAGWHQTAGAAVGQLLAGGRGIRALSPRRRSPRPSAARFFIGAHAQAAGLVLLTRDPARVRTYFPQVKLIAPER